MFEMNLLDSRLNVSQFRRNNVSDVLEKDASLEEQAVTVYYRSFPTKEEYNALHGFIEKNHIEIVDDVDFDMENLSFVFRADIKMTPPVIKDFFEGKGFFVNTCRELHADCMRIQSYLPGLSGLFKKNRKLFQITLSSDSRYFEELGLIPKLLDKTWMMHKNCLNEEHYKLLSAFLKAHNFNVIDNIDILPWNYEFYFKNSRFSSCLEVKEWFEQEGFNVTSVQFRNWTAEAYLRPVIKFRSLYTGGMMFFIVRVGMDSDFFSYAESHKEDYSETYKIVG